MIRQGIKYCDNIGAYVFQLNGMPRYKIASSNYSIRSFEYECNIVEDIAGLGLINVNNIPESELIRPDEWADHVLEELEKIEDFIFLHVKEVPDE